MNLFSVILLLGTAHGLFLALALLHAPTGNVTAHRLLAAITLVFALDLGGEFLYQTHYYARLPYLIWIDDPLEFLYGPLALFYVRALTRPGRFHFARRQWLHFLPVLFACLLGAPFYALAATSKLHFVYGESTTPSADLANLGQEAMVLLFVVQMSVYLVCAIRELLRHARSIRDNFSYTERIGLVWLRNLLLFFGALYLLFVLDMFAASSLGIERQVNDALSLLTVVMFYTMGYLGLRQPAIFAQSASEFQKMPALDAEFADIVKPAAPASLEGNKKYKTSALDADASRLLLDELLSYMDTEKPYLDCKLTLMQLASRLGLSTNYLSQIINEQLDKNFFDFVNHYRVEAAKRCLADPDQAKQTILAIALEAGFNSKTVFYSAFRKYTGMTPSWYRQSRATRN